MPSQIILNSSNYDEDSGRFIFNFPFQQTFNDVQVSCVNINIYNSFGNITSNKSIKFYFPDGNTHKLYTWTIPQGFYTIKTFFNWLKTKCDEDYLYTLNTDGSKYYYFFMGQNSAYENLILFYRVSTTATPPDDAIWNTPDNGETLCPYIIWDDDLRSLFGYSSTQIGNGTSVTTSVSYKSDQITKINPINSLILTCNLIKNSFGNPSNILTTLPVAGKSYGSLLTKVYPKLEYQKVSEGKYSSIDITIYDQNLNRLKLIDSNILIVLSFK